MRERSGNGPSDDLLLHLEVRNRPRTLPVTPSTISCSEPGINHVCWTEQSSWIRIVMGLPPACPADQKWSPRAEYITTHGLLFHLPLTETLQWIVQMFLNLFTSGLGVSGYTDVGPLWQDVAAVGTPRGIRFLFYTSHRDLFWGCTFHLKLEQSKVQAQTASEQYSCSGAWLDQALSVDRINKAHCYEPPYRISMPWFKQLLVTRDTGATGAVAVTQQHPLPCNTEHDLEHLATSRECSARTSGNPAPSDSHQCRAEWGTIHAGQLCYVVEVGAIHFADT